MASTRASRQQTRERLARIRAEERRRQRRRTRIIWASGAVAAVVVALVIVLLWPAGSAAGRIAGLRTFSGLSRAHVSGPVTYAQRPPAGGPHNPVWLNCGIYAAPVPDPNAVHSLEHGAVWITYRPGLPAVAVRHLRLLVAGLPPHMRGHVILSPYPRLPGAVVASAWGKQVLLHGPADPRLREFITRFAQGPQAPEPGGPCSGGTGTPLS